MSVFSKEEINDRLRRNVDDPEGLVITPLLEKEDAMDSDSIDLRLGSYFLLPRSLGEPYFAPDRMTATSLHVRVHVPLGRYMVVPAHQTVLGATLEFIKLPCNASGEILTKSSVARTFILVETAPWIHPEYRGCLTLEIANVSNMPVLLYPGRPIGQLILLHVDRKHDPTLKVKSTYFGPVYPEAPPFKNPEEDLRKIGIRRTAIIRKGTIEDGIFKLSSRWIEWSLLKRQSGSSNLPVHTTRRDSKDNPATARLNPFRSDHFVCRRCIPIYS